MQLGENLPFQAFLAHACDKVWLKTCNGAGWVHCHCELKQLIKENSLAETSSKYARAWVYNSSGGAHLLIEHVPSFMEYSWTSQSWIYKGKLLPSGFGSVPFWISNSIAKIRNLTLPCTSKSPLFSSFHKYLRSAFFMSHQQSDVVVPNANVRHHKPLLNLPQLLLNSYRKVSPLSLAPQVLWSAKTTARSGSFTTVSMT